MSKLKSKQIIRPCKIYKTGKIYLRLEIDGKEETLLNRRNLSLSPTIFKKLFPLNFSCLQWVDTKTRPSQKIALITLNALTKRPDNSPGEIHTTLTSFEAIFGSLGTGLIQKIRVKKSNRENNPGLYRYSQKRMKPLKSELEHTFGAEDINWAIGIASRQQDYFNHSCNIQLRKEGQDLTRLSLEEFSKISNFLYTNIGGLLKTLCLLKENRGVRIIPFIHENNSDRSDLTIYLDNLILSDKAKQIIPIPTNKSDSKNLHKKISLASVRDGLILQKKHDQFSQNKSGSCFANS